MSRLLAIPALATEAPAEGLPTGDYLTAAGTHELLWLLIALPLAGAAVLLLGGRRTNSWGPYLAIAACGAAFLLAVASFFALLDLDEGATAERVLGTVDAMKLRSSMTLFAQADPDEPLFTDVLERYFDGAPDPRTIELLG